ncbi:MAG: helix-turn-helix domain-containing protein [Endomicrobia bacterium]|nr:helix-turn-helix domain-containing protein [Endomicrobiia bacterium]
MGTAKEEIAKNLKYYRKKRNITQKYLASMLGVQDNTVSQWENCVNSIDVEVIFKICDILKISANDIFGKYSNAKTDNITERDRDLIDTYKKAPAMQEAVDKLLGIDKDDTTENVQINPKTKTATDAAETALGVTEMEEVYIKTDSTIKKMD